jgi:hypothetical protein
VTEAAVGLIVVGDRGHSTIKRLLLGTISKQAAEHAEAGDAHGRSCSMVPSSLRERRSLPPPEYPVEMANCAPKSAI